MRRLATIALTFALLFGLNAAGRLLAQDDPKTEAPKDETKKDDAKTDESKKDEAKKDEAKKDEAKKDEAKPASAADQPPIPPEVEAKLEAARRAVAEAIVAAQDAGLVKTTIDPPPILDILVTGRATDADALKARTDQNPEVGVSPEVFGAWFTGYGKLEGVTADKNVRIIQPSKGLKDWYDTRAKVFNRHIAEARKAKGGEAPKDQAKTDEARQKEEAMKAEAKQKEEAAAKEKAEAEAKKKEEAKKAEEEAKKKEEAKKAEEEAKKKEEAKKAEDEAKKKEEAKKAEDEAKKEEAKKDEAKDDEPKADAPKEEKGESPK